MEDRLNLYRTSVRPDHQKRRPKNLSQNCAYGAKQEKLALQACHSLRVGCRGTSKLSDHRHAVEFVRCLFSGSPNCKENDT